MGAGVSVGVDVEVGVGVEVAVGVAVGVLVVVALGGACVAAETQGVSVGVAQAMSKRLPNVLLAAAGSPVQHWR